MADIRGATFYPMQSRNREEKRISLRFFPQGADAVVNANNVGNGAAVTRGATAGLFTVVFDKPFNQIVPRDPSVAHATLVHHARVISIQTDSNGAATGFTFQVYTAADPGVAVDVAAAATSWISIEVTCLNTRLR